MRLAEHIPAFTQAIDAWMEKNVPHLKREDIKTGKDAWTIAHRAGVMMQCYDLGRDIVDAHIQTMLQRIFPNAVFHDAKRY